jgi:hypothetical protein
VSTAWLRRGQEGYGAGVFSGIVELSVGPGTPQDARPGSREDASGMGMIAASSPGALVDVCRPRALPSGVAGEASEGDAKPLVAGPPPSDHAGLSTLIGNGSQARLTSELLLGLEALPDVAELSKDLSGADAAGPGERHDDAAIGQLGDHVLDAAADGGDLGDESLQGAREGAHEFSLGFALGLAGTAGRGGVEVSQQGLWLLVPIVGMASQEAGQALGAEPRPRGKDSVR